MDMTRPTRSTIKQRACAQLCEQHMYRVHGDEISNQIRSRLFVVKAMAPSTFGFPASGRSPGMKLRIRLGRPHHRRHPAAETPHRCNAPALSEFRPSSILCMAHESVEAEQSVACCGRSMRTPHAEGGRGVNRGVSPTVIQGYQATRMDGVLNDVDSDVVHGSMLALCGRLMTYLLNSLGFLPPA
ncbi:hypothetical protein EI94DRAFT_1723467 [Lactarius quietus]|nr:hypothetical protein EI94DRAFT_1723467 [Lactarius quietus]